MGWTHCFTAKHYTWRNGRQVVDRKACCDDLCNWDSKDENGNVIKTYRVLQSAMVGSVYYAAVETVTISDGTRRVWGAAFLTCGKTRHDGTIWGYNNMSEDEGPYQCKCPVGILNLLTPTTSEWANKWRQDCRDFAAKKASERRQNVTPPGGITCTYRGGWFITSPDFRARHPYTGVRYHRSFGKQAAISKFVELYGTDEQKAAWTAMNAAA